MLHPRKLALTLCLTFFLPTVVYAVQGEKKEEKSETRFDTMAEILTDHFQLEVEKDELVLTIPEQRQAGYEIYRALVGVLQYGGGGGGSDTRWHYHAGNSEYSECVFNIQHTGDKDQVFDTINYQENVRPYRRVEIQADESSGFTVKVSNPVNQIFGSLLRDNDGNVRITYIRGEKCQFVETQSWRELVLNHGELLSEFGKLLSDSGIRTKYADYYPSLLREIETELTEPPAVTAEFRELIDNMRSAKFKEREAATKKINENFEAFKPWIVQFSQDEQVHPEVRSRLQRLLAENAEPARKIARELIRDESLLENPKMVLQAWLAKRGDQEASAAEAIFVQRLQELTGKNYTELAEWQKELAFPTDQKPIAEIPNQPIELKKTAIAEFTDMIQLLCRFTADENGRFALDRKALGEEYGGKSPKALHEEMLKAAKERNLPKAWVINESKLREYNHEHLLFQRIKEKCLADKSGQRRSYSSTSNEHEFLANRMQGRLSTRVPRMHRQIGIQLNGKQTTSQKMDLYLGETDVSGAQISFVQTKLTCFLTVSVPSSDIVIVVASDRKKIAMHLIHGNAFRTLQAENFKELAGKERAFLETVLVPTLRQVGVVVDLGSPSAD